MRNFAKLESEHVFVEDFLDDENSDVPEDFYPVKKNNNNNGFYFNWNVYLSEHVLRSTINDPKNIVKNALTGIKSGGVGSNRGVKFFRKYENPL